MRWKGNHCNKTVAHGTSCDGILCASEAEGILRDFKGLQVWKKAHALALNIFEESRVPMGDRANSGLKGQSRRAAISIAANIAEGCGRDSQREFVKFLNIAFGSATELEYHMILARDLGLITASRFRSISDQIEEVRRTLTGLIQRIRSAESPGSTSRSSPRSAPDPPSPSD